jgi:predicted permease
MTESLLLSTIGAGLGLIFAWAGREALLRLVSADGARAPVAAETDVRLIAFAASVSILTAVLFGSVPAWRSLRASLVTSLASRRASPDRSNHRVSSLLVIAQVAVSLVLLMGAGLFLRTLTNLRSVDLGFVPERLAILNVNPRTAGYRGEQAVPIVARLRDRLKTVPGVGAVSYSDNGVMYGRDSHTNVIRPEGFVAGKEGYPRVAFDIVGPNYFSTMGIPLTTGRDFTEQDDRLTPLVIAINEEMATRFFPGANPIGRRFTWGPQDHPTSLEVIAVVRDVKQRSPRDEREVRFYVPHAQRPDHDFSSVQFLVRTATESTAMLPTLQRAIAEEEPRLSVEGVYVAHDFIDRALVRERMIAKLSFAFGALAAGLACIGLYGLIGYQVVQRTNEIGIRMALGAKRTHVLWSTLRRALVWTFAGVALGIPLALIASRAAESLLFGLSPMDIVTLFAAAAIMVSLGALAAYIPAHRASRVDPVVALRSE